MKEQIILVAGATGNLGGKIIKELKARHTVLRALVRPETERQKIKALESQGVKIFTVDQQDTAGLVEACSGVSCIVSALSGLEETIIDYQRKIVAAAVQAGVPRFIPSDYCLDFTKLKAGTNRNLDLRRRFHDDLAQAPIRSTTIFNGAFMDLLKGDMPLILYQFKRILYWGSASTRMDLTTMSDAARFTACAALDEQTPRYLRIAGDRICAAEVAQLMTALSGHRYKLWRAGSIGLLNVLIKVIKTLTPRSKNLYPVWQGMQYMRDMMEGKVLIDLYDNDRYPELSWTPVSKFLEP